MRERGAMEPSGFGTLGEQCRAGYQEGCETH